MTINEKLDLEMNEESEYDKEVVISYEMIGNEI